MNGRHNFGTGCVGLLTGQFFHGQPEASRMILAAESISGPSYVAVALLLLEKDDDAYQADEPGDNGNARELEIGSVGQKHRSRFPSIGRWHRWYTIPTEKRLKHVRL